MLKLWSSVVLVLCAGQVVVGLNEYEENKSFWKHLETDVDTDLDTIIKGLEVLFAPEIQGRSAVEQPIDPTNGQPMVPGSGQPMVPVSGPPMGPISGTLHAMKSTVAGFVVNKAINVGKMVGGKVAKYLLQNSHRTENAVKMLLDAIFNYVGAWIQSMDGTQLKLFLLDCFRTAHQLLLTKAIEFLQTNKIQI